MNTTAAVLLKASAKLSSRRLEGLCLGILLVCWLLASPVSAQGLVKFANSSTTLVSSFGNPISGPAGSYYFALLTAPVGTTDPTAFPFSGLYATNTGVAGRIQGGSTLGVPVPGWGAGTSRAFMVCGWPSSMGYTWNPAWIFGGTIAKSMIATGMAGGTDPVTGGSIPALPLFSSATISSFDMFSCLGPYFMGIYLEPQSQSVIAGATVQ
jgi:hypothetical protein